MEWYRYDKNTGEYLHPVTLNKDPLNPGKYFPVDNAVPDEPLPFREGFACVRQDGAWAYKEDHREKTVYNKTDKIELEIKDLGPIPETHTQQKPAEFDEWNEPENRWQHNPEKEHEAKAETERTWAMIQLAATDRCLTPDYPLHGLPREELQARVMAFREKLRKPARTDHPDFPEPKWRPEWPEGVKEPAG